MLDAIALTLIGVAVLAAIGFAFFFHFAYAHKYIDDWAEMNHYRITKLTETTIWSGPYFLKCSKAQRIFKVKIITEDGDRLEGYIRVGSFWLGQFINKVDSKLQKCPT